MNIILDNLKRALVSEDIEGIISSGAPLDEYSSEAEKIFSEVSLLSAGQINEESVISIISLVWDEHFGPFSEDELAQRLPAFERLANVLLSDNI
jgi:hypothetical protein